MSKEGADNSLLKEGVKYYTIGQIASQYHVSADALRYYEDVGLIKPLRSSSGYRLYTDLDIWKLNVIINLRNLDFSIERIRTYFDEGTIDSTVKLLEEEQRVVDLRLEELTKIKRRIVENLNVISMAQTLKMDEITVKHFGDRKAVVLREEFSKDEEMDRLMMRLADKADVGLDIIGNRYIAAVLAPLDQDDHIYKGAVMFRDDGTYTIAAGDFLSVCYSGKWNSRKYAKKLIEYASEHNMKLADTFLDFIWIDIHTAIRMSDHISEIQVRIIDR